MSSNMILAKGYISITDRAEQVEDVRRELNAVVNGEVSCPSLLWRSCDQLSKILKLISSSTHSDSPRRTRVIHRRPVIRPRRSRRSTMDFLAFRRYVSEP